MTWLRGGMRLRETRFWGLNLGLIYYPPEVLAQRGFKIIFYDPSDVKVGEIGSDVLVGRASSVEFELMDFGCGAWSLTLEDRPGFDIGYRTRVDIHPYFSDAPWFSGFVQSRPKEGTARPVTYSGFGFYEQLDWIRVTGSYAALDIAEIVKNIIENVVAPNTQIIYNSAKVVTTGYIINSINFDHTPAKDAIQTLAEMAQNYEYGVDNFREFYFRAVNTEVKKHLWTGKHLADQDIEEDPKPIRNRLYVKVGQIQTGGTNYIEPVENGDSIIAHGLREDEITAPEILNNTDALQWANYILNQKKDPLVRAQLRDVFLDDTRVKIDAVGRVRITTAKGTEYTLAIKRVQYKISAAGILADIELGQILIPFEQHIVNLLRRVTDEQRLGDKRTAQLYPDGGGGGGGGGNADTLDGYDSTAFEMVARKNQASGYCGLDNNVLIPLARIPSTLTGKDADTVDGQHASAFAPAVHHEQHEFGGGDAIKLDDLAAPDDNADLDASPAKHGLETKGTGKLYDVRLGNNTWGRYLKKTFIQIEDDFVGGIGGVATPAVAGLGDLGWEFGITSGSGSVGAAPLAMLDTNHIGVLNLETGNALDAAVKIQLRGKISPSRAWKPASIDEVEYIIQIPNNTEVLERIGLFNFGANEPGGGNDHASIWFNYDSRVGPNWYASSCGAPNDPGATDTGIACVAGNWYVLKIKRISVTQWDFYINDVLVVSRTTKLPDEDYGFNPEIWVKTLRTSSVYIRNIYPDYFRMLCVPMSGNRYT